MDTEHKKKIAEGKAQAAELKKITKANKRCRKPGEIMTRKAAMRTFCVLCMGGESDAATEVKNCTAQNCPLFPYRLGNLDHRTIAKELKTGKFI